MVTFQQLRSITDEVVAINILLVLHDIRPACYYTFGDEKYREIKTLMSEYLQFSVLRRKQKHGRKIVKFIIHKNQEQLIADLKKTKEESDEYHAILGKILGYPCRFPKVKNLFGYSIMIEFEENGGMQIFAFTCEKSCDKARKYALDVATKTKELIGFPTYVLISEQIAV